VGCGSDGYVKTGYRGEDNIKKDIWTGGRGRSTENRH